MDKSCAILTEFNPCNFDVGEDLVTGGKLVKQLGSAKSAMRDFTGRALARLATLDGGYGDGGITPVAKVFEMP